MRLVRERVLAWLSGFFGLLAGVLAMVGLYGVIAYMVTRRQNEIGIRLALGATRRRVLQLILRDVTAMLMVGIAVGSAASLVATRGARSLLFGLEPHDPIVLAVACSALGMIALIAGLPASVARVSVGNVPRRLNAIEPALKLGMTRSRPLVCRPVLTRANQPLDTSSPTGVSSIHLTWRSIATPPRRRSVTWSVFELLALRAQ